MCCYLTSVKITKTSLVWIVPQRMAVLILPEIKTGSSYPFFVSASGDRWQFWMNVVGPWVRKVNCLAQTWPSTVQAVRPAYFKTRSRGGFWLRIPAHSVPPAPPSPPHLAADPACRGLYHSQNALGQILAYNDDIDIYFNPYLRICLLILEREEGGKGERKREKHWLVASCKCSSWWNPQPRYVPWPRIKLLGHRMTLQPPEPLGQGNAEMFF